MGKTDSLHFLKPIGYTLSISKEARCSGLQPSNTGRLRAWTSFFLAVQEGFLEDVRFIVLYVREKTPWRKPKMVCSNSRLMLRDSSEARMGWS